MARRGVKRAAKSQDKESALDEKKQVENEDEPFMDPEVERQKTAIRAICDMEIEHVLTGIRLLRSYLNEDQLQAPVLQFFEENLPNVSVVNGSDGQVDLNWKYQEVNFPLHNVDTNDIHASLLRRLSMTYPRFSEVWKPYSGFPLPSTAGIDPLDASNILSVGNYALENPYQCMTVQDGLQTPGANGQRMSIGGMSSVGMTPKTQRHPKHGEMLLSVHGSPLGVFKEDNIMESIVELEEG